MKLKILSLIVILSMGMTATAQDAVISNVRGDFSCADMVTVLYDLVGNSVDVALFYSPDGIDWIKADAVTGALISQVTGNDRKIIWDSYADGVRFGHYYIKIEEQQSLACVMINNVCWARTNLDGYGNFVAHDYDGGGHYQWGRTADGHADPGSPCWQPSWLPVTPCGGANFVTVIELDATVATGNPALLNPSGQPSPLSGAIGKFIRSDSSWSDPRITGAAWNTGTEPVPVRSNYDPCPEGWRVPTDAELTSLTQTAQVTRTWSPNYNNTGVNGWVFEDRVSSKRIFLPNAGQRYRTTALMRDNDWGYYWSSRAHPTSTIHIARYLFLADDIGAPSFLPPVMPFMVEMKENYMAMGFNIRCVNPTP